jgi:hypothetical protein
MPSLNLYLSSEELELVNRVAGRLGITKSHAVRLCFRKVLGLPIGDEAERDILLMLRLGHEHVYNLTPKG